MNTMYAKSKIEKLMAVATHTTTNQNEAQNAYNMAKKVAEKYKVLSWFFLTYEVGNQKVEEKQVKITNVYDLSDTFRWEGVVNILYRVFYTEFEMYYEKVAERTTYFKGVTIKCTEQEYQFICKAYKFILKNLNRYCKSIGNFSYSSNISFCYYLKKGFYGYNEEGMSKYSSEAYLAGQALRREYEEFKKGC